MKNIMIASVALFLAIGVAGCKKGNGDIVTRSLSLSSFDEIHLKIDADVFVRQGPGQEVLVTGEADVLDRLDGRIDDDEWEIEFTRNVGNHERLEIYITLQDIDKLKVSGSGKIVGLNLFIVDDIDLEVDGSGMIDVEVDAEDVKSKITIATNSQTSINDEQLLAFSEFQKNLEQFYKSFSGDKKLYYERRTGQYSSDQTIIKSKIVTIKNQIKTISSMFLNSPHLASGYYGKLFKTVQNDVFRENHEFLPYYTSSYFLYRFEKFIRAGIIDRKYNKARYHILMLFQIIISEKEKIKLNSKEINEICQNINNSLDNMADFKKYFNKVKSVINNSGIDINNQKVLYQKSNTEKLITSLNTL